MTGRAIPVPSVATDKRDLFFEKLVREREPSVVAMGVNFEPSDMLQLDPLAYEEVRQEYLTGAQARIETSLDNDSLVRLERLTALVSSGRAIPFVGAGMSTSCGYPTWTEFLVNAAEHWITQADIKERLKSQDLEGLANDIEKKRGSAGFEERLEVFDRGYAPSEETFLILDTFKRGIVTTNFDGLLETAISVLAGPSQIVEGSGQWAGWAREADSGGGRVLLKLHGHHARRNFRVLLENEYDAAYSPGGPVRRDLKDLFSAHSLVFLGCSLSRDRTMEIAHETFAERDPGSTPPHYAILPRPIRWREREVFLTSRGIYPIWYRNEEGTHTTVGDLLWTLRENSST